MPTTNEPKTITVTVFARHSANCPKYGKEGSAQWKRCKCRKSMYIYKDGKTTIVSCKTRSWEEAEKIAQEERDKYDPALIRLQEIEEKEQAKVIAKAANEIDINEAVSRWVRSLKVANTGTLATYTSFQNKVSSWASTKNCPKLADVTPMMLDEWRSQWAYKSPDFHNRMSPSTQVNFQKKLKAVFEWAVNLGIVTKDPTYALQPIRFEREPTMPLNRQQFEELLATTDMFQRRYIKVHGSDKDHPRDGQELKTLFLLMRFSGLRISDALTLSRTSLTGKLLDLVTIKTGDRYQGTLVTQAVDALHALPRRPEVHPDYFFWSKECSHTVIVKHWVDAIASFDRRFLKFKDENGDPMSFHSHMLRDTFAIELLLINVPIEKVSKLLTHKTVAITEKYYAPWVKGRRDELQETMADAMRRAGYAVD